MNRSSNKIQDLDPEGPIDEGARLVGGRHRTSRRLDTAGFLLLSPPSCRRDRPEHDHRPRGNLWLGSCAINEVRQRKSKAVQIANDTVLWSDHYVAVADGEAPQRWHASCARAGRDETAKAAPRARLWRHGSRQMGREGGMYGIEDFTEIKAFSVGAA